MDDVPSTSVAPQKPVVIGTAGHIDHGKTALIRALTGIDTDRLPEEKRRGITIDLGFASMSAHGPDGSPVRVSFIDVPGHARFVRNMLAGVGGIDAVLLVVSAEEGVKPQTVEHLAICSILGIERGLTVLTKIDAVSQDRVSEVRVAVERFLSTTFLASAPIVSASARSGEGMDDLRRALGSLAGLVPSRSFDSVIRLPIDRAFTMTGFGAVVTGTLMSGSVSVGQELALEPGGRMAKVRGIQVHGSAATQASAATRAALNLARIEAAQLQRGDTLVEPSTIAAVDTIDAEVTLLPGAPSLKHRASIHFHALASECMAVVSLYDYRSLGAGGPGLVRLRLSKPIVLVPGDRFVLRHGSPITTIGGGRVLDSHPLQRLSRAKARIWLEPIRHADLNQQLAFRILRRGTSGISIAGLTVETGLKQDAIRTRLAPMIQDQRLLLIASDLLITHDAIRGATDIVAREFESLLQNSGVSDAKRSELRSRTGLRAEVFEHAVKLLEHEKKIQKRNEFLLPSEASVPRLAQEQERLSAVARAFKTSGLAAPSPAALAAELGIDQPEMRRLVTILLREKTLIRLGDDSLLVHQFALAELKQKFEGMRGQAIDVSRFKQLTGVSRKYAIPLLEYLDRERIMKKQGEQRVVL